MPCRATASGRSARGSTATSPNRSTFAPSPRKSAATSARMRRLPQVDAAVHGGDAHFSPAGAEFALQMLPELPGHDERIVGLDRPVHRARFHVRVQLPGKLDRGRAVHGKQGHLTRVTEGTLASTSGAVAFATCTAPFTVLAPRRTRLGRRTVKSTATSLRCGDDGL